MCFCLKVYLLGENLDVSEFCSSNFRLRCQKGATPLHWAAEAGCLETCKIILGANPYIIDVRDFRGVRSLSIDE